MALTARDAVAGTVRLAHTAAAADVRPVHTVRSGPRRRTPVRGGVHVVEAEYRVALLARNASGWARLCRIVPAAPVDGVPVVSWPAM
ncbi:hypothetical protein [Streptomyces anulatus]|uniref:hypothetical protein n=1 Tax=Streptomyces anulatus TaxID=1892 RepID=UPI003254E38A